MVSAVDEQLLDERLAALEEARAWSPRLISKHQSHIGPDDQALFRINAFSFAEERHLPENEIIDLFLQPRLSAFSRWIGRCTVRNVAGGESSRSLKSLHNRLSLPILPGWV